MKCEEKQRRENMNNAKLKFLDNLYDETRSEVMKRVEAEVIVEVKKKIKTMVSANIITDVEAKEFATSKNIDWEITAKRAKQEFPKVVEDPCHTSVRVKPSC
jgi:hypothetical protein